MTIVKKVFVLCSCATAIAFVGCSNSIVGPEEGQLSVMDTKETSAAVASHYTGSDLSIRTNNAQLKALYDHGNRVQAKYPKPGNSIHMATRNITTVNGVRKITYDLGQYYYINRFQFSFVGSQAPTTATVRATHADGATLTMRKPSPYNYPMEFSATTETYTQQTYTVTEPYVYFSPQSGFITSTNTVTYPDPNYGKTITTYINEFSMSKPASTGSLSTGFKNIGPFVIARYVTVEYSGDVSIHREFMFNTVGYVPQPGDIYVTFSASPDHSAIIYDNTTVIDADGSVEVNAIKTSTVSGRLGTYNGSYKILRVKDATSSMAIGAAAYAYRQLWKPYNHAGLLFSYGHREREDQHYCNQLSYWTWRSNGVTPKYLDDDYVRRVNAAVFLYPSERPFTAVDLNKSTYVYTVYEN